MKIEAGKTYKTRRGHKVRVVCTDLHDPSFPVIGLMTSDDGTREAVHIFTADGHFDHSHDGHVFDLVAEWREPITYWATVNPDGNTLAISKTRSEAEKWAVDLRARVVKLVEVSP